MDGNGVAAVILMADDDTDDQVLVQEALAEAEANVELRCVDDGEALMNYLHQTGAITRAEARGQSGDDAICLRACRSDV